MNAEAKTQDAPEAAGAAEASSGPILSLERLTCRFGSLVAVNQVDLQLRRGEFCAVIGPNGAGKTTLFNMVTGLVPPTEGRIVFAGDDVSRTTAQRRVALGMARTFQITEIFPDLTVRETLRVAVESAEGLRLRPWLPQSAAVRVGRRVDELLALAGLGSRAHRVVGELSHGDQRITEIAMTLALRPKLLLLDEPTAGMGDQETYEVTALIKRLHADQRLTTVLIEHDMRVIFHLAERIVVMADGTVLAVGTPEEISANEAVQAAYLGSAE